MYTFSTAKTLLFGHVPARLVDNIYDSQCQSSPLKKSETPVIYDVLETANVSPRLLKSPKLQSGANFMCPTTNVSDH